MTGITSTTDITTNSFRTIYTVISGNVSDITSRGGSAWIFSSFPSIQEGKNDEFPGYPIITIETPELSLIKNSGHGNIKKATLSTMIDIHCQKKVQIGSLTSSVVKALDDRRNDFIGSGMHNMHISSGGVDTQMFARNQKVHTQSVGVTWESVVV